MISRRPFQAIFTAFLFVSAAGWVSVRAQDTPADPAPGEAGQAASVVKIYSTVRYPDPYKPWSKQNATELSGSGAVIDGKRILTCAHLVLYASQIQVQGDQAGDKISATVEAVAPDMDLAVLKLDDETFFDTHRPLPRADKVPPVDSPVRVYGYPLGGTGLSVTRGIVSRVEFAAYNFPGEGLRIQIDAAINPGNSGGPAMVNDRMVGLAFSRLTSANAQNIGYIIPCEEIDLFLKQAATGHYNGKPVLMDNFQMLENPSLRSFLKLDKSVSGVVVYEPYDSDPAYPLKKWDVITRIGDMPIDDSGMVKVSDDLRVGFKYLVQRLAAGGKVPLTVVRDGKETPIQMALPVHPNVVIPFLAGRYPSYFIYGPVVFSEGSQEFIMGLNRPAYGSIYLTMLGFDSSPLVQRMGDKPAFPGERLVIIASPFFPHHLSKGYANPMGEVVKAVNGIPVKNLAHLVALLRDAKDDYITIELYGHRGQTVVFPRAEMAAATDEILSDNGIRGQGSPDVMTVWNASSSGVNVVSTNTDHP